MKCKVQPGLDNTVRLLVNVQGRNLWVCCLVMAVTDSMSLHCRVQVMLAFSLQHKFSQPCVLHAVFQCISN